MPRQRTATHGSETMYGNGCPCDECRLAHNARRQAYRERRRAELRGERAPDAPQVRIDAQTGEVPMTPGQKKLAEILAAVRARPGAPERIAALRQKALDSMDEFERIQAGEE